MKNWKHLIWIAVIAALLIAIGYFYDKGFLHFKWQWLTILFATLAAPYRLFMKWINGSGDTVASITAQHDALQKQELDYRDTMEAQIKDREQRVALMQKDLDLMDTRIQLLQSQKAQVDSQIQNMSIDDKIKKVQQDFGS
jgi:hypothetical protein